MRSIAAPALEEFTNQLLLAAGALPHEARCVARSLVGANLRGYESHGVMRTPYYIESLAQGETVSGVELLTLNESESRIAADAQWGFGQVQMGRLLELLTAKTRATGLAVGTMIHASHIGRLGEYCETAADLGLVSMVMVNSHGAAVRVAPPGGKSPRLSTNPLAIGSPCSERPLILDFSTSATAEGKVRVKKIAGERCPPGWLLDSEGRPTEDPNVLYQNPPGSILPMGGAQAYKGFGLSLMIEILTGALSGGVTARPDAYPRKGNCVFVMLLDPEAFGGGRHFQCEVAQLVEYITTCPRVEGCEQILLPGDPERMALAQRLSRGIPLDEENWKALVKLADRLGVSAPDALHENC